MTHPLGTPTRSVWAGSFIEHRRVQKCRALMMLGEPCPECEQVRSHQPQCHVGNAPHDPQPLIEVVKA